MNAPAIDQFAKFFAADPDGVRPGVVLRAPFDVLARLHDGLVRNARVLAGTWMWDEWEQQDVEVASIDAPAVWVRTGRTPYFHCFVESILIDNVRLPELGVYLTSDSMTIDWRGGWAPEQVAAFVGWLVAANAVASISLEEEVSRAWREEFRGLLSEWRR